MKHILAMEKGFFLKWWLVVVVYIIFLTGSCKENGGNGHDVPDSLLVVKKDTLFLAGVAQGLIENEELNEASGIVVSRSNPDFVWAHNDSGDDPRLFLVGSKGEDFGQIVLEGIVNRDWEDIAIGPGPEEGQTYLYIGEIGDNSAQYEEKMIYRLKEPDISSEINAPINTLIKEFDTIRFQFADGNRDAETLMIDPKTKDLYIISKREANVNIYLLKYPYSTSDINIVENIGQLPYSNVVGGDISPKGNEILVRTYTAVYCWAKKDSKSIPETFLEEGIKVPYQQEPQGEAVAWKADASGYFTLSEEPRGLESILIFYKRKE